MEFKFHHLLIMIIFCLLLLVASLYLLANINRLFKRFIKNELIRKNLVVWLVAICIILAISPTSPEFSRMATAGKVLHYYLIQTLAVTGMVLFVFNVTWFISDLNWVKTASFRKKMATILITVIVCTIISGIPVNYFANGSKFVKLEFTLLFNLYTGCIAGFIYVTMSYVNLERQRKLDEKELELSKLHALKTKAELDALHSKINPHFLYNALNSIADLAITDGKKARKMTIALADLFRYSINSSDHNYSTIKEEVEMTEVYLEIEKIRFEDQLNYSIHLDKDVNHYLVPRFLLQPVVENAVKHGLKATGKMTEINITTAKNGSDGLQIMVADNGPAFPDELTPGDGIKRMYDKLDLLFPGNYEIHFKNQPEKMVTLNIHKLMKNEPAI